MPSSKVVNLGGGLFRSKNPEQIPEISFYDLINFDILDDSLVTRQGSTALNSSGLQPGCLRCGFSKSLTSQALQLRRTADYSFEATTVSNWDCFVYSKSLEQTGATQTIVAFTDDTASPGTPNALVGIRWGTTGALEAYFRRTSAESLTTITSAVTISSATTHLYGLELTPMGSTTVKAELYDHTGVVATTISASANSWGRFKGAIVGGGYQYIGELCVTQNESVSTTTPGTSYGAVPPGTECATANRIAYYPFTRDYSDKWGLNPDFYTYSSYRAGGGLVQYQVEDPKLTSPQLTSILHSTKSIHVYEPNDVVERSAETSSLSTTFQGYFNGASKGYTITFPLLVEKYPSTATSFTLLDTSAFGGFNIKVGYNSAKDCKVTYKHTFNTTVSTQIETLVPLRRKSLLMFDYDAEASSYTQKIFRDFGEVATTTKSFTGTARTINTIRLHQGTATTGMDFYDGSFIMHNVSVGTTWSKKPPAKISSITSVEAVKKDDPNPFGVNGAKDVKDLIVTTRLSEIGEGDQTSSFDQYVVPSFSNVVGMYAFSEFSGYDYAQTTDDNGRLINYADTGNANNSDLIMSSSDEPTWMPDRKAVGLTSTGYCGDEYNDEFDSVYAYVPAKNLGSRIMFADNMNLVDEDKNTYVLDTTFAVGRKGRGVSDGFVYGNDLYFISEKGFMKFDGNSVKNLEVPSPNIRLGVTPASGSSGMNGTFGYTYVFKGASGNLSQPAVPTSCTVATGTVALTLNLRLSDASVINDVVTDVVIYRTKGSVGTTTNLTNNNGTFFYELATIPIETVRDKATTTLYTDSQGDESLGAELKASIKEVIPRCKYASVYQDSGVYTGSADMPNHYFMSEAFIPETLDGFNTFQTEDGNKNTSIIGMPTGFLVFKRNARKLVRNLPSGVGREFFDGGCMSNGSLANVGEGVIGLGESGFFYTEGHNYHDITGSEVDGRKVSSIQLDVDTWNDATKEAATAVFHDKTYRYICYVNDKYYVYHTKRRVWRKYEDFVGQPVIYKGDFYIYKKGWLWKEVGTQYYIDGGAYVDNVVSGGVGYVTVTSTTTLPTKIGLPMYIDNTFTNTRSVTNSGTTYTIRVNSNVNFSSAKKIYMGVIECNAETKGWTERTDHRLKHFKWFRLNHDGTADGEINLRYVRRGETMDDDYNHYTFDTDKHESRCLLGVRTEDARFKMNIKDGKEHTLKAYQIDFEQGEYGV